MDPVTMKFLNHGINQEQRRVNNLSKIFEIGPRHVDSFETARLFELEEGTSTNVDKKQHMCLHVYYPKMFYLKSDCKEVNQFFF